MLQGFYKQSRGGYLEGQGNFLCRFRVYGQGDLVSRLRMGIAGLTIS